MHAYSKDPTRLAAFTALPSWSAKAALCGAARWLRHSWLGKALVRLIAEREARLAIDELRTFDDRMLRDIGLQRMDIEGAVRGEFRPLPRDAEPMRNASAARRAT